MGPSFNKCGAVPGPFTSQGGRRARPSRRLCRSNEPRSWNVQTTAGRHVCPPAPAVRGATRSCHTGQGLGPTGSCVRASRALLLGASRRGAGEVLADSGGSVREPHAWRTHTRRFYVSVTHRLYQRRHHVLATHRFLHCDVHGRRCPKCLTRSPGFQVIRQEDRGSLVTLLRQWARK